MNGIDVRRNWGESTSGEKEKEFDRSRDWAGFDIRRNRTRISCRSNRTGDYIRRN
jgi:hypothetical protein